MLYKIAICDDDEDFTAKLNHQVSEILKNNGIDFTIAVFSCGEKILSHIKEKSVHYDLFLLDIFMKEINGVDTAKAIRLTNDTAAIIFITSSHQYVFSGYEVQALQYLLKPVNLQALSTALMVDIKKRFENRYFVFKLGGTTQKVPYDHIEYFESQLKSVRLVTIQGEYEICNQISNIENDLPRLSFCRCHRGFIIHFKKISKINAQSLTTVCGTMIPIGKTYTKATNRAFLNYISGSMGD